LKIESERTTIDRSKTFREKTMEEKPLKDKVDVGLEFKPFIYIDVLSFWFNKFI